MHTPCLRLSLSPTPISIAFSHSWCKSERLKEGEIDRIKTARERWAKELNPRLMAANKVWLLLTRHSGFLIDTCNSLGAQTVKEGDSERKTERERLFFRLSRVEIAAHHSPNHKMKGNMVEQNEPKANCHWDHCWWFVNFVSRLINFSDLTANFFSWKGTSNNLLRFCNYLEQCQGFFFCFCFFPVAAIANE